MCPKPMIIQVCFCCLGTIIFLIGLINERRTEPEVAGIEPRTSTRPPDGPNLPDDWNLSQLDQMIKVKKCSKIYFKTVLKKRMLASRWKYRSTLSLLVMEIWCQSQAAARLLVRQASTRDATKLKLTSTTYAYFYGWLVTEKLSLYILPQKPSSKKRNKMWEGGGKNINLSCDSSLNKNILEQQSS